MKNSKNKLNNEKINKDIKNKDKSISDKKEEITENTENEMREVIVERKIGFDHTKPSFRYANSNR